ncbi:hypothetical protein ABZP36_007073 [Zizania latifolia]
MRSDTRCSESATRQGLRDRDIAYVWNHDTKLCSQDLKCKYCGFTNKCGGATRLRDHLGGIAGTSLGRTYQRLSSNFSDGGSRGNKKGKRVKVDEEIEFEESKDGDEEDEFEDVSSGSEDNSDHGFSIDELNDWDNHEQDIGASPRVEQDIEVSTMVDPKDCISGRLKQKKRNIQSLYQRG